VEPFEFTSNGGGGEALPRRVKKPKATFYEVIISNVQKCSHLEGHGTPMPFALTRSVRGF